MPAPLPSLGVNDYTHRFAGSRLIGAVGSTLAKWDDASATPNPITNVGAAYQIAETGGARFVKKVAGTAGATGGGPAMPHNSPGTIAMLAYIDPADVVGGTRYIGQGMGVQMGRAANSAWQAAGPGGYTSASQANAAWEFFAFAQDGSSSWTTADNDIFIQRGSATASVTNGNSVITPTGWANFSLTGIAALESGIAELVYWPRKLSAAELTTVRAAMMANSTLF